MGGSRQEDGTTTLCSTTAGFYKFCYDLLLRREDEKYDKLRDALCSVKFVRMGPSASQKHATVILLQCLEKLESELNGSEFVKEREGLNDFRQELILET